MLPIAEWHRGVFIESLSVMVRIRKRREGEVEQEEEGQEEENNQTPLRISMDGMEMTRHCEALEPM